MPQFLSAISVPKSKIIDDFHISSNMNDDETEKIKILYNWKDTVYREKYIEKNIVTNTYYVQIIYCIKNVLRNIAKSKGGEYYKNCSYLMRLNLEDICEIEGNIQNEYTYTENKKAFLPTLYRLKQFRKMDSSRSI